MTRQARVIPLYTPIWGDNRVWCIFARRDDIRAAITCPELRNGHCCLNGDSSPCAFDVRAGDGLWADIRESVAEYRRKGWPL